MHKRKRKQELRGPVSARRLNEVACVRWRSEKLFEMNVCVLRGEQIVSVQAQHIAFRHAEQRWLAVLWRLPLWEIGAGLLVGRANRLVVVMFATERYREYVDICTLRPLPQHPHVRTTKSLPPQPAGTQTTCRRVALCFANATRTK